MSMMKSTVTPDTATSTWDADKFEAMVRSIADLGTASGIYTTASTVTGTPITGTPWTTAVSPAMAGSTFTTVSTPKVKTLVAKKRMNKGTLARLGPTASFNKVKQQLAKDLLAQLMATGVIKVESDTALSGSVTFTASVVVNETA